MEQRISVTEGISRLIANYMATQPDVVDVIQQIIAWSFLFILACFGAALAEMFNSGRNSHSSIDRLQRLFPSKTASFYTRTDFAAKVFGGALVALVLVAPANERQAVTAGLGWAGALTAFLSRRSPVPVYEVPERSNMASALAEEPTDPESVDNSFKPEGKEAEDD